MRTVCVIVAMIWASPWSLFGLLWGGLGLLTGGHVRRCGHTLEFWGGGLAWLLRKFPIVAGAAAVTFGHVVLAQGEDEMNECRDHEMVHVRQYERWGPIFIPAYLGCSVAMWLRGKDPYRDNPFEREAFEKAP